jgi:hypothetical protein
VDIISLAEARAKGLKRYFTGEPCQRGHIAARQVSARRCCACSQGDQASTEGKAYKRTYYRAPKWMVRVNGYGRAYRQTDNGKGVHRAHGAFNRALKSSATPPWVDRKTLDAIWKDCPDGYHVDHIHPLKGKYASGLNVPWNLNYLPAEENMSKHNHMPQPGYFDWFSEPCCIHAPPVGRVWTPTHYD